MKSSVTEGGVRGALLETQAGRKNAKESEAAVTAADESMVSCQTECSCCLLEGRNYMETAVVSLVMRRDLEL